MIASVPDFPAALFAQAPPTGTGFSFVWLGLGLLGVFLLAVLVGELLGMRYIPNSRVGIVEKLWSRQGSIAEGRLIALDGEAGYQADLLRGGFHFGLWRWQYRI